MTVHELLSPRQVQVLQLVARGKMNKNIAHDLGISEGTVKTHLFAIMRKLDANSRTDAATIYLRAGVEDILAALRAEDAAAAIGMCHELLGD